ncbi:MAG: hypothetical protein IPO09_02375 [Anaeromyxobacter sp.]|nr:hypothetical protein [Anaeromyxobacter sp.]
MPVTPAGAFRFSFYNNRFDNNPDPSGEPSFADFAKALVAAGHRRGAKDGLAFSPAVFRPGTTRALDNVEVVTAVGLDLEHVTPARMAAVRETLKAFDHVLYSTHSHRPEEPRFRAIIALERELPASLHPQIWALVADMVGTDAVDPATKDASRLFYLPAAPEGATDTELEYHPADGVSVFALDPLAALGLTETQYAEALARTAVPSLAPAVSIIGGLVEKKGALALKPRPTRDDIAARVRSVQNAWSDGISKLLAGQPYADMGGRDAAAHGIASSIAFTCPEADIEDITALFAGSVATMEANGTDPSNPPPSMAVIEGKVRRALNAARTKVAGEEEFRQKSGFGAAIDAARLAPYTMPVVISPENAPAPEPDPRLFHGLAGRLVRAIEPHTEASTVAILAQLLVALGSVFGRAPFVLVEATRHHCNEFLVVVGRSARARKGTSWAWVQRMLKALVPEFVSDNIEHSPSSGEGIVYRVRDEVQELDKKQGVEVVVDPGVPDKRLLVQMAEFAIALQAMNRDGNILSSIFRMAWDGEDLGTLTKNNRCKATEPAISILAHITAIELRRLLNATEVANGLGNRFLFVYAERTKLLPEGGNLRQEDLEPFVMEFRKVIDFAKTVGQMQRDAAAKARWRVVYPELTRDENSLVGALTCRAEGHVVRLSMIFALLDLSAVIREEHLEAALAFWKYTETSCRIVFGDQLGDPLADALLAALRQRPEGLNRTDISRAILGGHKKTVEITRALAVLQQRGLAVVEQTVTAGRPAETWRATTSVSS